MAKKAKVKVNQAKGKKRTGELLSSFVVLTILLSVLAFSITPVIAPVPPPPPPPEPNSITVTADPANIEADGVATSIITATALSDGAPAGNISLTFEIISGPEDAVVIGDLVDGAQVSITDAEGKAYATLRAGITDGTVTVKASYTGQAGEISGTTDVNLFVDYNPDLTVTEITQNCGGYLFANESNEICAVIENIGPAPAGAFNVSFVVDGFREEVRIATGLAVGANTTRCVNDSTPRNAGELVTITVTADCDGEVEELNEANNASSIAKNVVNNGYKGKTYTGGENITTLQTHTLNGSVLYSVGDSCYLSGATGWTTYTANWTASDLSVPSDATIEKARLYVMYTWDKVQGMPDNVSMTFNDNLKTRDAFYTDRKGYDGYDYPYGMLAYNVTADFDKSGNTAVLGNLNPIAGNPSIRGMLLVVIYADESEAKRKIIINEGFDLLYGGSGKCTTPEEATAYAPFADIIGDIGNKSARLITVAPGADPTEGELIFNGNMWNDVWNFAGATQIGIDNRDVTQYLLAENNEAAFQSSGDWMEASNAILVVEEVQPEKTIDYTLIKKPDSTGKNWISIPIDTTITNASSLMAAIGAANCDAVNRWNATTQQPEGWISMGGGMGTNFNIVAGEGYEISVTANTTFNLTGVPVTIGPIDLIKKPDSTGKNWIGLPYDTTITNASSLMAAIGAANCDAVNRWNATTQQPEGWISMGGGMGTNFDIVRGEGYEISVTANTTWTPI